MILTWHYFHMNRNDLLGTARIDSSHCHLPQETSKKGNPFKEQRRPYDTDTQGDKPNNDPYTDGHGASGLVQALQ